MHGQSRMLVAVKAASMILIVECKWDPNTFVSSVDIHTTFGLSPTAIAAVAENTRLCNKIRRCVMAYRKDDDLKFLGQLQSEDLNDLVNCLTYGKKDDVVRFTEELTKREVYKKYYPDHHQYWKEIAAEIQCFGANTFATFFRRGKGVLYKEVLMDVCDKLKVDYNKKTNVPEIENTLLLKVLSDVTKKMSKEELNEFASELGIRNTDNITPQIITASVQTIFTTGGGFIIKNTVGAILKYLFGRTVAKAALGRILLLGNPVGWAVTGVWTAVDIAGPAYRVTIPATIMISLLRKKRERYSIALIGDKAVGKTTLLSYLQKGCFVDIKEHSVEEKHDSFESPLWNRPVETVIDTTGAKEYLRKQKELCIDKKIVFFCYKPQDVLDNPAKRSCFLQRLQGLEKGKVFFIATHRDSYDINEMKQKMHVFFASPTMGSDSQLFTSENSFYVNLTNEVESKSMLMQILNKMEEDTHA